MDEAPWNNVGARDSFNVRTSQTFAIKNLVSITHLGHLWFKVSGRLFRLLSTTTMMQDAFVVTVHYDGGPRLYHWPRNDWQALYKDAKNDDVHVLNEPLFCKLSDSPLVLAMNELLDLKRVKMRSVDTGVSLWPKVASLILTTNDSDTGRAYDPNVWTARQCHGFRNFKVTLSKPRL